MDAVRRHDQTIRLRRGAPTTKASHGPLRMTLTIGIIGPPCSGKSTIARALSELGSTWINADRIASEQLSAPEVIDELVAHFGDSIVENDGGLSRGAIATLVFGKDDASRQRLASLESVIHPRVRQVITDQLQTIMNRDDEMATLDVPLLIESGWSLSCDEVWCTDVTPNSHGRMLAARGWTLDEAERRGANQIPGPVKKQRATFVISNHGNLESISTAITQRLARLRRHNASWRTPQHCKSADR